MTAQKRTGHVSDTVENKQGADLGQQCSGLLSQIG
jgi:hypothetical protein